MGGRSIFIRMWVPEFHLNPTAWTQRHLKHLVVQRSFVLPNIQHIIFKLRLGNTRFRPSDFKSGCYPFTCIAKFRVHRSVELLPKAPTTCVRWASSKENVLCAGFGLLASQDRHKDNNDSWTLRLSMFWWLLVVSATRNGKIHQLGAGAFTRRPWFCRFWCMNEQRF
jgi:hypothetical protein